MRTTVSIDDDVATEVERLRRERGMGLSAALNDLARRGMAAPKAREPFVQRTSSMGAKVDLRDIGEVLELVDGADHR